MKMMFGFIFGIVAAISLSAIANNMPIISEGVIQTGYAFVLAGGKDADGLGRAFIMTKDSRVLAKCD